jgi:peroxiredoxin
LRRFDEMQTELAKHDIRVVALSNDPVDGAAMHKNRDGLSLTLLSDPELKVIRQYGVEHHKALSFTTGKHQLGGIPLALMPSFRAMSLPTTLLIDEDGVIKWVDQTDDYRLRSNNERVLGAVEDAFGG